MVGLARFFNKLVSRSLENPAIPLSSDDDRLYDYLGGEKTTSGVRVNREKALKHAPVWRGMNLITQSTAKCKVGVWSESGNGVRELDKKHPASKLLRRKPNSFQTAFSWKQMMKFHEIFYGNAYCYIKRNLRGDPLELIPLFPDVTELLVDGGEIRYKTVIDNLVHTLYPENVLHFKALSYDGIQGYGLLQKARESIGAGMAKSEFASRFFENSAAPSGLLTHPGTLSDAAYGRLKSSWIESTGGLKNAHKPKILEEGLDWKPMGINARDAQLIEERRFDVVEVANFFGIPPHKLGDNSRAAYNTLEQQNQEFLDDAIDPGLVNWEEEMEAKLLTEKENEEESKQIEFDRKSLVRADAKVRAERNKISLGGQGWRTTNEVRREDGLNPIEEDWANEVPRPLNINTDPQEKKPADEEDDDSVDPKAEKKPTDPPNPEESEDEKRAEVVKSVHRLALDISRRMVKRITSQARSASKKPDSFHHWLDSVEAKHRDTVTEAFSPLNDLCRALGLAVQNTPDELLKATHQTLNEASGRFKVSEFEIGMAAVCDKADETLPALIIQSINLN